MKDAFLAISEHSGRLSTLVMVLGLVLAGGVAAQETVHVDADAPTLTLEDCLGVALESSPTLAISEEQRHIAAQDVTDAWGAFLPSISLSRDWGKSERTDFDVDQYMTVPGWSYDSAGDSTAVIGQMLSGDTADETVRASSGTWGGRATLNVFSGFSKFSSLSSSKHSRDAADATTRYTRELVVQDVITAYFNLLRYEKLLEVAIETRDQATRELERTETYFRLGSTAKSDVLQQRVRLENTKLDVVVADNNVKKAFANLAYAMNRPLAEPFRVDASALATDFAVEDLAGLYQEALASRQDLVSNEHKLEARRNDVTTASSGLYPSLNVYANYSYSNNESPYRFGSQKSEAISFGYSVSWNVFDRLQTWTGRSRARANARIAEYELEQARMNVQVEIRQLHTSLIEARERSNVSKETIEQSKEELRLAQERFRVGAGTTLDVITAQVNLASARAEEVQAICDFLIAEAQIRRATGRLTQNASR